MLIYDPADTYWNCVCLLLPGGKATLVDIDVFERYGHSKWYVLRNDSVCRDERYTVIANPTAWRKNQKTRVKHRLESLSRLVLGFPSNRQVDHINRKRLDNRRCNLRVATSSQNAMNKSKAPNKSSRYKGVSRQGEGKWVAQIAFEGNQYHLGTFADETEAALAYNAFINAHCPEFGHLNPIPGATANDEPTSVKLPPKKRRSKLAKLTPKEQKIKKLHASLERTKRTEEKRRQKQADLMAARKAWQPGDPTWPPAFVVRLRAPRKAVNYWGEPERESSA